MIKFASSFTLLATVFVGALTPAHAQASRTFVSSGGSDSNSCANATTPCRHLQQAYAVTNAGGEIEVLDPADYGPLIIAHAISIEGRGWAAINAATGQVAITINAGPSDKINISGVVLDGLAAGGNTGIQFNTGANLNIQDSVIRNFGAFGINFAPNASSRLSISNTLVSDNTTDGIFITGSGSAGTAVNCDFDHVTIENNTSLGASGMLVLSDGPTIHVTVSNSVSAGNPIGIVTNGAAPIAVMVQNSTIANNGTGLVSANSTAAGIMWVSGSAIIGNGVGWTVSGSGTLKSFGNNSIVGNTSGNNAPPLVGLE
jgi:hypothetical protein